MQQRAGSQGRETFNFQKSHTSHRTRHIPRESLRVTWPFERPRFAGARNQPPTPRTLQTYNRSGVTEVAQLLRPFLSTSPAFVMHETSSHLYERAWGGPSWGGQKRVRPVPACPVSPWPQYLQLIHREPRPLIRARQPGTSTHPCWPHLPPRASLCLWLQTGCG